MSSAGVEADKVKIFLLFIFSGLRYAPLQKCTEVLQKYRTGDVYRDFKSVYQLNQLISKIEAVLSFELNLKSGESHFF